MSVRASIQVGERRYAIKPLRKSVGSGRRALLKLKLRRSKDAGSVIAALKRGRKVTLKLRVTFTDHSRNTAVLRRTVRLP